MNGFIQLHRKLLEWEWYSDHNATRLFIHLLLKANHDDKKWRGTVVKKGSFITSIDSLSREVNMSPQQVRTSLKKIKSTKEITTKSTNKFTAITIVNWCFYQGKDAMYNKQITNKQQTNNKQITTNNNDNNDNNDNKLYDDFSKIWDEWKPFDMIKGNKKQAFKKYQTARKEYDHETIITGMRRYIEYCQATECKTKHVATWLNQRGWETDYSIAPTHRREKTSYADSLRTASSKAHIRRMVRGGDGNDEGYNIPFPNT